jgi:hypothetical protein
MADYLPINGIRLHMPTSNVLYAMTAWSTSWSGAVIETLPRSVTTRVFLGIALWRGRRYNGAQTFLSF